MHIRLADTHCRLLEGGAEAFFAFPQRGFGLLEFGDVAVNAQNQLAPIQVHDGCVYLNVNERAIFTAVNGFLTQDTGFTDALEIGGAPFRLRLAGVQQINRLPDQFLAGVAVHSAGGFIAIHDGPVRIGRVKQQNGIRRVGKENAEPLLAFPQRGFRLFAFGDVAAEADQSHDFPLGVAQRNFGGGNPDAVASRVNRLALLADEGLAGYHNRPVVGVELGGQLRREAVKGGLADQVFGAFDAHRSGMGGVADDEAAFRVLDEDVVGQRVNQRAQQIAFVCKRSLRLSQLGHIHHGADHAQRFAALVALDKGAVNHPRIGVIGAAEAVFTQPVMAAALDDRVYAAHYPVMVIGMDTICPPFQRRRNSICSITKKGQHRAIPGHFIGQQVPVPDSVVGSTRHQAVAALAFPQRGFCRLALGDVAADAH